MLTKVIELQVLKNEVTDHTQEDVFVCTPCLDRNAYTVAPEPETKEAAESECECDTHE